MNFPVLPNTSFWLGHLPQMQRDTYGFYSGFHKAHGDHLRFKAVPGIPFYSFASPEAFKHILVSQRQNYTRGARWRRKVAYLGGNGLISNIGEDWQRHRHHMLPYFHAKRMDGYASLMVNNTLSLLKSWQALPDGTPINVSEAMMFLALINVSDTLFGYDIRKEATAFSEAMENSFTYIDRHIVDPLTPPRWLPTKTNRHFKRQLAFADRIAYHIIAMAREGRRSDMVSELVRSDMSEKELRDEIITLLMAGHDTTATGLAWSWYLLARHPEALETLRAELCEVLKGDPPRAEHYDQLHYTRMVFEETLRLYPSVWSMHRFSEVQDEVNGYPVKKGCSIALPVYVTHRNPAYWQKPDQFYPQHFDKVSSASRPRFAYLPFGAGERVCIGMQFAMLEGVLMLATLIQQVRPVLGPDETIYPEVAFTLKPHRDIMGVKSVWNN